MIYFCMFMTLLNLMLLPLGIYIGYKLWDDTIKLKNKPDYDTKINQLQAKIDEVNAKVISNRMTR